MEGPEVPGLREAGGELGVAPVADEAVDGGVLLVSGLAGRLPHHLWLHSNLLLFGSIQQ